MAYNSAHTGPQIDAAVEMLGQIQSARDATAADRDEVAFLASQVDDNASQVASQAATVSTQTAQVLASAAEVDQAHDETLSASAAAVDAKDAAALSAESAQASKDSATASASAAAQSQLATGLSEQISAENAASTSEDRTVVDELAQQVGADSASAALSVQNAAAVVTGGTAALASGPGKIPLANAQGKIDSGWLGAEIARTSAIQGAIDTAQSAEDSADLATARTARFLAPVSTPPVIRDDGAALQLGDRYVNTGNQAEYIYKSSGWELNDSLVALEALESQIYRASESSGIPRAGEDGKIDKSWIPEIGAELTTFSHDNLYPPATAGFRFKRTLHSKDAPYNCAATGTSDDTSGLLAMFTAAVAMGGNCEIVIDEGVHGCSSTLRYTSNTTIRFVGSIKCLANPGDGYDCILVPMAGASNQTLFNPTINLNGQPAMNGIMCRTGNAGWTCWGGEVSGGTGHEVDGRRGGRGLIIETALTSFNNRAPYVSGLRIKNCYMIAGVQGGTGTADASPLGGRSLVLLDGISGDGCDVGVAGFGVPASGSAIAFPYPAEVMHIEFHIRTRNCGKNTKYPGQDGVVLGDRACNMKGTFFSYNTPDYPKIDSVIRTNGAKLSIRGNFIGDASSAICFSPFKEPLTSQVAPVTENSVQDCDIHVDIHGTVDDFIKNIVAPDGYVTRTNISGSATSITSGRPIPNNFVRFSSLHVDLLERTLNSRVSGCANPPVSG